MTETIVVSIVSAFSGLLGVVVGTFVPLVGEWLADRKRRDYAAIRLVCALDKFVEDCARAVGQEESAGDLPVLPWPTSLKYPDDIDWRLVNHKLTYRALKLPNEVEAAANAIIFIEEAASTEHDPQHLSAVTNRYTPLGIEAADLARTVRRKYKLPEKTQGHWDPEQFLRVNAKRRAMAESW